MNKNKDKEKYTIINLIMGVWCIAYNIEHITKNVIY